MTKNEPVFSNEQPDTNKGEILFTTVYRNFYNQERMAVDFGVPELSMEGAIEKAERQREVAGIHNARQFGAIKLKMTCRKKFKILNIVWLDQLK